MTRRIFRLPPAVRDQIAAGEIVERPASVVKELVENSLDAEARRIEVHAAGGGIDRLRVRDDGLGIAPADLPLAVERHATSKLTDLTDLATSPWLGFRGEALAAIAAVSHLTLASRPPGESVGHRIRVERGRVAGVDAVAMAPGTAVEVEGLFLGLPARLKALAAPASELARIHRLMAAMAVGFPDVSFHLVHEGRALMHTDGRGDGRTLLEAIAGAEAAEAALEVRTFDPEASVTVAGWILPTERARPNRLWQVLFVNRRLVTNWVLRQAVEEAFRPGLPEHRFPAFWLKVTVPGDAVDPNAHPAKAEVRLARERAVAAALYRAVSETLRRQSPSQAWTPAAPTVAPQRWTWDQPFQGSTAHEAPAALGPSTALGQELAEVTPLGQWAHKYIVAQGPGGLYLIDQHAAHERVYFERLLTQREVVRTSQPLLWPLAVEVPPQLWAGWQRARSRLRATGFDISEVGGTTLVVRALPGPLAEERPTSEALLGVLAGFDPESGEREHPWADEAEEAVAMAACKAAIKAWRPLAREEIEALIRQLAACRDPRICPHGRPTVLKLTLEEVDRRFGRTS
ncbi:MAG: DNA mismatch repair endonuclease MutL [Firmicutes bacterium]|nr:DNA mismatch repair endonuclease MutL [Alicyclobacillaceae bacterium]MCL6496880.1 DNA mismatch repair endonuclease MutL [Bacillota bacterium]